MGKRKRSIATAHWSLRKKKNLPRSVCGVGFSLNQGSLEREVSDGFGVLVQDVHQRVVATVVALATLAV